MSRRILLKNATVLDGMGNDPVRKDLVIDGDRILSVGKVGEEFDETIDLAGLHLAPGFIDMHSHSDHYLLIDPRAASKIHQGVTTEVIGHCGYSAAPIDDGMALHRQKTFDDYNFTLDWRSFPEYMERLRATRPAVNTGVLVGHGTLRGAVLGQDNRPAEPHELAEMVRVLTEAMECGAVGLSTGLVYPPGCFAEEDEIHALLRPVSERSGLYCTHMRSEGDQLLESCWECLSAAEATGVKLQISHLKAYARPNWSKLTSAFDLIERACERGVDVWADRYPYTAAATDLDSVLPKWVFDGGVEKEIERLSDGAARQEISNEMDRLYYARKDYYGQIMISGVQTEKNRDLEGLRVTEAAQLRKTTPKDLIFDLLCEERCNVSAVFFVMSEKNLERVLKKPYVTIGSDASARAVDGVLRRGVPHPRAFGSFPRVIQEFVLEKKLLSLPEAIQKMTSFNADRLGWNDRGRIKEGAYADLVAFDLAAVKDTATYKEPYAYPTGICHVWVNGERAIVDGKQTDLRSGRILPLGS